MINELLQLADYYDKKGKFEKADIITQLLKKQAMKLDDIDSLDEDEFSFIGDSNRPGGIDIITKELKDKFLDHMRDEGQAPFELKKDMAVKLSTEGDSDGEIWSPAMVHFNEETDWWEWKKESTNNTLSIWKTAISLYPLMFEVDSQLSEVGANWNHNLASTFRLAEIMLRRKPEGFDEWSSRFDSRDSLQRGQVALKELQEIDPGLAKSLEDFHREIM